MNKIISFVMVGTNDLEKSSKFYDAIFARTKATTAKLTLVLKSILFLGHK